SPTHGAGRRSKSQIFPGNVRDHRIASQHCMDIHQQSVKRGLPRTREALQPRSMVNVREPHALAVPRAKADPEPPSPSLSKHNDAPVFLAKVVVDLQTGN